MSHAPQLKELLPRKVPALRLVPAPPLDVDREKLEDMIQDLRDPVEELKASVTDLSSSFERLRALGAGAFHIKDIREVVERGLQATEDNERTLAAEWREVEESRERQLMRARELSLKEPGWATYADLLDEFISLTIHLLEGLRDFRLELAAVLTATDDEVDSPVFDDPLKLKKYLEST